MTTTVEITDEIKQIARAAFTDMWMRDSTLMDDAIDHAVDTVAPLIAAQARRQALEKEVMAIMDDACWSADSNCCSRTRDEIRALITSEKEASNGAS